MNNDSDLKRAIELINELTEERERLVQKIGSPRVFLTEGWYTVDVLEQVIEMQNTMSRHIDEAMGITTRRKDDHIHK